MLFLESVFPLLFPSARPFSISLRSGLFFANPLLSAFEIRAPFTISEKSVTFFPFVISLKSVPFLPSTISVAFLTILSTFSAATLFVRILFVISFMLAIIRTRFLSTLLLPVTIRITMFKL
uniref:Uncharacterized protein n=1 Tax=Cacopsylla melanoneura TaxID=428564 RepID=A0A8D8ZNX8_9HEMI